MTASRRHRQNDRQPQPARQRRDAADPGAEEELDQQQLARQRRDATDPGAEEEFDMLEPVAGNDLDALEPVGGDGDSVVRVTCSAAEAAHFDTLVEIAVPEMEKKSVLAAVEGPLRHQLDQSSGAVRHRRVLVRFTGEAVIGTAVKERTGTILAEHAVLLGVVRRGYGDEVVHEGALPEVSVKVRSDGDLVRVLVGGEVAAEDLSMALAPELDSLCAGASGKSFEFVFENAEPGPGVCEQVRLAMAEAGAQRAAIGGERLFDRELEARVRVSREVEGSMIEISQVGDEAQTLDALTLVLRSADFAGQRVLVKAVDGNLGDSVIQQTIEMCSRSEPAQVALDRGTDEADILVPRMLQITGGPDGVVVRVRSGDRGRSAMLAAFRREVRGRHEELTGAQVIVDWPEGFIIDAEIERSCLHEALSAISPRSVACSIGGEGCEPFVPAPVTFGATGNLRTVRIDADAGKPGELVRAIERRMGKAAGDMQGQPVRVEIVGSGAASRTMMRAIRSMARQAGASRLELVEQDNIDVLLPELLRTTIDGNQVMIAAAAAGRDGAQLERAMKRELAAIDLPSSAEVTVSGSPVAEQVIAAVIAGGAARVLLGGDELVQVHPALFSAAERDGDRLCITARPGADGAVVGAQVARELPALLAAEGSLTGLDVVLTWPGGRDQHVDPVAAAQQAIIAAAPARLLFDDGDERPRQLFPEVVPEYVTVLGRKDDADPPILMLGLAVGHDSDDTTKVLEWCEDHAELFDGRRVLLVLRDDARDRPIRDDDAMVTAVRGLIDPRATATLLFRGVDARRIPFFEVVHSGTNGLAVGVRVADPRPGR